LTASTNYWVQITNIGPTIANSAAATAIVIASLTAAPGNYSNIVGAAYPSAFAVTARDYANNLASNVPVTFTAPQRGRSQRHVSWPQLIHDEQYNGRWRGGRPYLHRKWRVRHL
jgi:hypothetical protein